MLSFPGDRVYDGTRLFRIVVVRGFYPRKQERVGKGALAPLVRWIVLPIEQQIVDGCPCRLILVVLLPEPCGDGIWRNPLPIADPIIHAFAGKSCCRECKANDDKSAHRESFVTPRA
jgi:hypothetical protein